MNTVYNEYSENPVKKTLKQRKKRKLKKKLKIVLFLLIFGIICFYLLSDYSKVKSITISGLDFTTKEDVLEQVSVNQSSYYWLVSQEKIEKEVKALPAVKDVTYHCDWIGNVTIEVSEAHPIAYAQINKDIYEINDIGNIIKVTEQNRLSQLKVLSFVSQFTDEKLLKEFAKEYKNVPSLMQNEISDIMLDPKNADPTRLKCLTKEGKTIYIRIEDVGTRLDDEQFNYQAYKTEHQDKCVFSIEGKMIYIQPCQ